MHMYDTNNGMESAFLCPVLPLLTYHNSSCEISPDASALNSMYHVGNFIFIFFEGLLGTSVPA